MLVACRPMDAVILYSCYARRRISASTTGKGAGAEIDCTWAVVSDSEAAFGVSHERIRGRRPSNRRASRPCRHLDRCRAAVMYNGWRAFLRRIASVSNPSSRLESRRSPGTHHRRRWPLRCLPCGTPRESRGVTPSPRSLPRRSQGNSNNVGPISCSLHVAPRSRSVSLFSGNGPTGLFCQRHRPHSGLQRSGWNPGRTNQLRSAEMGRALDLPHS